MAARRDMKIFAFASPTSGEGKSMTCANVAAALGQTAERVLILSADLRKPTIHEFFSASGRPGLSEVLEGKTPFHEAVERTEIDNVWVLSGGQFPATPVELLQSSEMADLIRSAAREFDFVIIDCPPILGLADCLAVLPLVDAVLLVVQAGRTRGELIVEASNRLERLGVSIHAAILNNVKVRRGYPGHSMYGYYVADQEHLQPEDQQVARPPSSTPLQQVAPSEHPQIWTSPEGSSRSNGKQPSRRVPTRTPVPQTKPDASEELGQLEA